MTRYQNATLKETGLVATGVRKVFKGPGGKELVILDGVDLTVQPGEKVAIVGRSGAGKSTLLHILGGLLKPTAGKVVRPRNFGFVFQSYHLMPELTILENVLLPTMAARVRGDLPGRRELKARALELIERVGLAARLRHLPGELSGGERQRVAIARSLVTSPALVLADEPTGNLDALTGAGILKLLAELSGSDTSLVLVTHSPDAAAMADRTLTLENGRL